MRIGMLMLALVLVALGVAAIAYGEVDDAPGLVLLGGLVVLGGVGLGLRTVLRS